MLNAYIEENPKIDLFVRKFEKDGGVRQQRKKSEERTKKTKQRPLVRSGSQGVIKS